MDCLSYLDFGVADVVGYIFAFEERVFWESFEVNSWGFMKLLSSRSLLLDFGISSCF